MSDLMPLLAAMRGSLEGLAPHVADSGKFELRVLMRALDIVQRELAQGTAARALEQQRLAGLLSMEGELDALKQELCARLRDGRLPADDPRLLDTLRACVEARLAIDSPDFK